MSLGISIDSQLWTPPAVLTSVEVRFPANLGLATSGLGLASCAPDTLLEDGSGICPANSKMGTGTATVGVAFGPGTVREHVVLTLYAAPSTDGYLHLAILATGKEPVSARIVLQAVLLPGRLAISVPEIRSLPGAADVAVLSLHATLGGRLTYYERVGRRTVAYEPRGIGLPSSCPLGGWPFSASLAFADGSRSHTRDFVSCPHPARRTARLSGTVR